MQHYSSLDDVQLGDVWLTIGSFDGVHTGHQTILRELVVGAQLNGAPAVVITFFPHPAAILRGKNNPFYLSSPEEKADIFEKLGVDILITHPFNRNVANKTAHQFISGLIEHLNIRHLQVGYDFAMGKNRNGDISTLQRLGKTFGFSVKICPPIEYEKDVISSTRIRFLLGVGQVEEAAVLLGRFYSIQGIVEIGDQRGREMGFPTANMAIWADKLIPTAGVYVCWAKTREKKWGAVTNIGVRPTFEAVPVPPRVEAHLLDFDESIYGEEIQLEFVSRLRDEQRFSSIDHLVAQIHQDSRRARKILFP